MTHQMSPGSQIAFTRSWLDRQGIESQLIDVEGHIDPSLSYEENIKLFKHRFKLGGGRSRQMATRNLSAAECDLAIGNYEAGFNHEVTRDACACGHPDACVDLERAGREAKAAKPKQAARSQQRAAAAKPKRVECDWWKIPRDQWVDGHIRSPAMHRECVRQALDNGYKVPAKVLKDYPDLAKKQAAAVPPALAPAVKPKRKPAAVPPALAPAAAPKRKKTATAVTKKPKPPTKAKNGKPKKAAAKTTKKAKNGKPAGIVLTAAQKKRLAADGSVTVKRGGKFVTVTR